MTQFRPQVSFMTRDGYKTEVYPTYKELKKNITKHLNESTEHPISVSRSRRSEWGEWFEHWKFNANGKSEIVKEGWM